MSYKTLFQHADDVIAHLNSVVPNLSNPLLEAKYSGFVTIAAVTVYEMAIKNIFINFAKKKQTAFGNFVEYHFDRINGKIKLDVIQNEYVIKFGPRYKDRFKRLLQDETQTFLVQHRRDFKSAYTNLVVWRNDFAHEGRIKVNTTYSETVQAYEDGKMVIHCLAKCMVR